MFQTSHMDFRIADTFTDSLARLTSDEQKLVKTTAFDLQIHPANPGMQFHKLAKAKDKSLVARIGMETEFPLSPSGSVRRCVRTQAVRARSLCSGLFGRVGSP